MRIRFTEADIQQMRALGIDRARVLEELSTFHKSDFSARLSRPCTLGDGVRKIEEDQSDEYLKIHKEAAEQGRFMKFVPASGAASRMFQSLLQIYYLPQFLERDELYKRVDQEVAIACDFLRFLDGLNRFAFVDDLRSNVEQDGLSLDEMVREGQYRAILEYLLTKRGLNYGCLPKALLKFHSYGDEQRTAFEEQLAESVKYLGRRRCKLHFTAPEDHADSFKNHMEEVATRYRQRFGVEFEITYSFQKHSTNTI
ncbi:MAG: DUF4301 family protein, partial [Syntrophobacteraceae bacterium]